MRGAAVTPLPLRLLDPAPVPTALLELLREEGRRSCDEGWRSEHDGQGLVPAQRTTRGELGPAAAALMEDPRLQALAHDVAGRRLRPSWSSSCYTRYGAGDFLARHTDDARGCSVAVLLYLDLDRPPEGGGPGLGLEVHEADAAPGGGAVLTVTARRFRLLVLEGSRVPHGRPRLGEGESVTLLSGCYREAWQ